MARVQLALNVSEIDSAVDFYRKLFGTGPAKVRPGYANFEISEPPLKLVLIEGGIPGTLNHLGVEVDSIQNVQSETSRLGKAGLSTRVESGACCFAIQNKVWVADPDGAPWEVYTVLADAPEAGACC